MRSMRPSSRRATAEAVLARVAAELPEHQRGRHRAPCLIEVASRRISSQWARTCLMLSVPPIIGFTRQRWYRPSGCRFGVAQVADARGEAEAQQVHEGEDVIGEALPSV